MKSKPWTLCREFECRNPTWSGKMERDVALRYCHGHSPQNLAQLRKNTEEADAKQMIEEAKSLPKPVKKKLKSRSRLNPFSIPLVCVYREYETIRGSKGVILRTVFTSKMCGKRAPRRSIGDRSLPRFPNWRNEPLCKEHGHADIAESRVAFPDTSPGEALPLVQSQTDDERRARDSQLAAFMRGETVHPTKPILPPVIPTPSPRPDTAGFTELPETIEQWNVPHRTAVRLIKLEATKLRSPEDSTAHSWNHANKALQEAETKIMVEWTVFSSEEKMNDFVNLHQKGGWLFLSAQALRKIKKQHRFSLVRMEVPGRTCKGCSLPKPVTEMLAGSLKGHWHLSCLKKARGPYISGLTETS